MTRHQQILSLAGIVDALARRYPGDRDELRQVAWLGAIRAVDTWDGRTGSLTSWAWTCCNWEIGKHIRKASGHRNDVKTKPPVIVHEIQPYLLFGPDHDIDRILRWSDLERCSAPDPDIESAPARIDTQRILDRLAPRDRAIVLLLSEYSQHEIARMLGCGQATIGRVVARAREAA